MASALIIHSSNGNMMISQYDSDGRMVDEGFREFIDLKCSGSVRVSRYEFGEGVLIVIES